MSESVVIEGTSRADYSRTRAERCEDHGVFREIRQAVV